MKKRLLIAVGLVLLVASFAACGNDGSPKAKTVGQSLEMRDQKGQAAPAVGEGDAAAPEGGAARLGAQSAERPAAAQGADPLPNVPPPNTKLIKNASIEVRVADGTFQRKLDEASRLAEELGGFVSGSNTSETKGEIVSGTITLRVPADRFQTALSRLRGLGKVTAENQSGQDVTKQFVDLESRLKHLRAQEAFFLRLLDQSKSISDLVSVQQQLSNVQLQIEQIQGELQYLKDQTTYATVTARIFEPAGAPDPPAGGLGRAWQQAVDGFMSVVSGLVIAAGWAAPFALIALGALWGVRLLRRRGSVPAA